MQEHQKWLLPGVCGAPLLLSGGWLLIHYFFCLLIFQFAWGCQNGKKRPLNSPKPGLRNEVPVF